MFEQSTRFLVVDDFATMRKIMKKALNDMGYTDVVEADDGDVALNIAKEEHKNGKPFQFIISDWNMPKMQGIDLLKNLKQHDYYKDIPFMMVTAEGEQKQIIEAIKSGVSEYVVKPFSPAIIKSKIERVYTKTKQSKAAA